MALKHLVKGELIASDQLDPFPSESSQKKFWPYLHHRTSCMMRHQKSINHGAPELQALPDIWRLAAHCSLCTISFICRSIITSVASIFSHFQDWFTGAQQILAPTLNICCTVCMHSAHSGMRTLSWIAYEKGHLMWKKSNKQMVCLV